MSDYYDGDFPFGKRQCAMLQNRKPPTRSSPHTLIHGVEHKNCARCGIWKSLQEFHAQARHTDGLASVCKRCIAGKVPSSTPRHTQGGGRS
jgi:hypothetical protein